jgi:hypothetical protein
MTRDEAIAELKARQARGLRILDAKRPCWQGQVDPDRLQMDDCENCVLGQAFGSYLNGCDFLWTDDPYGKVGVRHGFDLFSVRDVELVAALGGRKEAYKVLEGLWADALRSRGVGEVRPDLVVAAGRPSGLDPRAAPA